MIKIVPIYAGLLAVFYCGLTVRTIRLRRIYKVALGYGSSPQLEKAMRVHGNFAEYVPLALILLTFLELQQTAGWLLHAGGIFLVLGRVLHAYGVSQFKENFRFRIAGMVQTLTVVVVAGLIAIYNGLA